jgi:hypothetical protein
MSSRNILKNRLLLLTLLFVGVIFFFGTKEEANAQYTCSYNTVTSCSFDPATGCSPTTGAGSVGCTLGEECPSGGNYCWHSGWSWVRYVGCDWDDQQCILANENTYGTCAGNNCNCGCAGGGSDDGGDDGGGGGCDCGSCGWTCHQTDQSSSTIECDGGVECDGDGDNDDYACRPNCCGPECSNPCSCTPSCTSPSGLNYVSPAAGTQIHLGSTITWSLTDWGKDSNQSSCSNNSCQYQSYSGNGRFKVLMDGVNISSYCSQATGTGNGAYITGTSCTFDDFENSWPGTTHTFTIQAYNNCGQSGVNRSYPWAPNERPYCGSFSTTGGRMAGNLYGVRANEQFSIGVTAGETDPYGPPNYIDFCYRIYAQPEPAQWRCDRIANDANSGTFTSTFNQMKTYFQANPYYNEIENSGFLTTANIGDNAANNFCNGWGMYIPADPVQGACDGGSCVLRIHNNEPSLTFTSEPTGWIGTATDSDNGLACNDRNPAVYQAIITDVDGSRDVDLVELSIAPQNQVADNNNDNVFDDTSQGRYWPLRVRFGQDWRTDGNQRFAHPAANTGTFMIRDMAVNTNTPTQRRCLDASGGYHDIDPTGWDSSNPSRSRNARLTTDTVWCYGYDNHTWRDRSILTNQVLPGVNAAVDVYYLNQDLTVDNEGYRARLKGNSNWLNATYVAYEINGDRVFANFVVEYLDDNGTDNWSGEYRNVWFINDILGKDDGSENLSGEYIADDQWGNTFHVKGYTRVDLQAPSFDLTPPGSTTSDPQPISASELEVYWKVDDPFSRIDRVYGEASMSGNPAVSNITNVNTGQSYDPNGHPPSTTPPPLAAPYLWNKNFNHTSREAYEVIDVGQNEQGNLNFDIYAQDNACNLGGGSSSAELNLPWILTRAGLVYTYGEPDVNVQPLDNGNHPATDPISNQFQNYPFNISKWEAELSSELLFSNGIVTDTHLPDMTITGSNSLSAYNDALNRSWYTEFYGLVENQMAAHPGEVNHVTGVNGNISGNLSVISSNNSNCNAGGGNVPCVMEAGSITVQSGATLTCNRKTVVFVSGDLTVNGRIRDNGNVRGCIFIVQGNVVIGTDTHVSETAGSVPRYDLIEAFIISDGTIHVQEDTVETGSGLRDGLKVRGGLLAFGTPTSPLNSSITVERSMKLLNNLSYPSLVVVHDTRYYGIAEEIIGGESETYKTEIGFK